MDSGSDKARNDRRAKRLLDAISRCLASSLRDGVQASCDIHVSDRTGRLIARRGFSTGWDDPGEIVVSQEPPASGQAPVAGET